MDAECGSSFSFVRIIFQARVNKVFFVKFYNGEKKLVSQFAQFQLYSLFGHIFYVVSWLSTKLSLPFKLGCKTVILIKFVFSYFYKLKDVLLPTVFNLLMMKEYNVQNIYVDTSTTHKHILGATVLSVSDDDLKQKKLFLFKSTCVL